MNEGLNTNAAPATKGDLEKLAGQINWLMAGVIIVLLVGFVTMFVAVGTMILDSFHLNSAVYQEYSGKMDTQNQLLETNRQLLQENKNLKLTLTPTPSQTEDPTQ